jgi:RHH-type transcriptional regulator, proline utilization regulon repressor / proline dehydrogenase / delta 1-pyrroline-5-carboxylate dehydrogenase
VSVLTGQYEDPEGQAIYYRIPLGPMIPDPVIKQEAANRRAAQQIEERVVSFDLASGLTKPFANGPASLQELEQKGLLYGPAVNKLTLMNYITTAGIRAMEWLSMLTPELPHMYLTSSRDEAVDKALRLIRCTRKTAQVAIAMAGGYYGHTIATTRSLSDPRLHNGGPGHFSWPKVPHPAVVGTDAAIAAIRDVVAAVGGSARCFGLLYEPVQERTGWVLPADFVKALEGLRKELDLPLIACESATATYRSGLGAFASLSTGPLRLVPDVMLWWGGAQTGYLHCLTKWFVPGPLTLVSTWDGDELSLIRQHHQLRAARHLDVASNAWDEAMTLVAGAGIPSSGLGAYRVISAGARATALATAFAERGLPVRRFPGDSLALIPALDQSASAAAAFAAALREVL